MSESDASPRVVVGVDGSAGSLAALRFAFDEAERRDSGLLVVAAYELPDVWLLAYGLSVACPEQEIRDNVLRHTQQVVADTLGDQMKADGAPKVEVVARGGGAAHVLLSAAVGNPLLVVGSRGLGGFRRMLLGSVSLQCALHAPCPVTVVRSATGDERSAAPELAGAPAAIL